MSRTRRTEGASASAPSFDDDAQRLIEDSSASEPALGPGRVLLLRGHPGQHPDAPGLRHLRHRRQLPRDRRERRSQIVRAAATCSTPSGATAGPSPRSAATPAGSSGTSSPSSAIYTEPPLPLREWSRSSARSEGPFGFYDQFLATADFDQHAGAAPLAERPSVRTSGTTPAGTATRSRQHRRRTRPARSSSIELRPGSATSNSVYQTGLTGIQARRARRHLLLGVHLRHAQFLTFARPRARLYDPDVASSWSNFYDLFPNETQQIFNGIISGQPGELHAPRVTLRERGSTRAANCTNPRDRLHGLLPG